MAPAPAAPPGTRSDMRYYYLKDHVGTIKVTVNKFGAVAAYDDFDPNGMGLDGRSGVVGDPDTRYKFTGKERDIETGYDYFGARYYYSLIGRWLSVDPNAQNSPSLTPYQYARNNPLLYFDPDGKAEFKVTVRTYIPNANVGPFLGDYRGPQSEGGTNRTQQIVRVETDPKVSGQPLLSATGETGRTIAVLPTGSPGVPLVLTGKAQGEFSAGAKRTEANKGNNVLLNVEGSASNPLVPLAPAIDYSFQIGITPGSEGTPKVSVTGSHDAFPAYEIYVADERGNVISVYQFTPRAGDVYKLFPPSDDVKIPEKVEER